MDRLRTKRIVRSGRKGRDQFRQDCESEDQLLHTKYDRACAGPLRGGCKVKNRTAQEEDRMACQTSRQASRQCVTTSNTTLNKFVTRCAKLGRNRIYQEEMRESDNELQNIQMDNIHSHLNLECPMLGSECGYCAPCRPCSTHQKRTSSKSWVPSWAVCFIVSVLPAV